MKKTLLTIVSLFAIAATSFAQTTLSITSDEIASGKTGSVELSSNAYGSQNTSDNTTWYTFAKEGINFTGAKVCLSAGTNGTGIQMQGNASDAAKQGFLGNKTALGSISQIILKLNTISSSKYAPSFNFCVGTSELPTNTITLPEAATDSKTIGDNTYTTYTYTINLADGNNYFAIRNDLAGALYIDEIDITYSGDAPATTTVNAPTFSINGGNYYEAQNVALACTTEGAAIKYSTDMQATWSDYTDPVVISESDTLFAKAVLNGTESEVVSAIYYIAKTYSSPASLKANVTPTSAGVPVIVTLFDEKIDSIYTTSKGYRNGIYMTVGGEKMEIYAYNVPETWEEGAYVSGKKIKALYKVYKEMPEICPVANNYDEMTCETPLYTATATTASGYILEAGKTGTFFEFNDRVDIKAYDGNERHNLSATWNDNGWSAINGEESPWLYITDAKYYGAYVYATGNYTGGNWGAGVSDSYFYIGGYFYKNDNTYDWGYMDWDLTPVSTGISNTTIAPVINANTPSYNLAGQRVNANANGIVIRNGRKYINK